MRTFARALVGTMTALIAGVTIWHARYGDNFGVVVLGTALALGGVYLCLIVWEPGKDAE